MKSFMNEIADGLAGPGFVVVDEFISLEEVKAILGLDEFQERMLQFHKAGVGQGKQINEAIRGDRVHWIDTKSAKPETQVYLDTLEQVIEFLNRDLFLSLKDYEVHFTIYPVGSRYQRHLDQFKKGDHRKLSVILYLNENWKPEEGGQLRMYLPEGSRDFLPIAGRFICFRSDLIEHEVLPATRERLSITGWILDQVADLRHL